MMPDPKKRRLRTQKLFGIYLISKRPRGMARLIAKCRQGCSTTFSERYAKRFASSDSAKEWITPERMEKFPWFRPEIVPLPPTREQPEAQ